MGERVVPSLTDVDRAKGLSDADRMAIFSTAAWSLGWQLLDKNPDEESVPIYDWSDSRRTLSILRPANRYDSITVIQSTLPESAGVVWFISTTDKNGKTTRIEKLINSHSEWTVYPTRIHHRSLNGEEVVSEGDLLDTSPYSFALRLSVARVVSLLTPAEQTTQDLTSFAQA